VKIENLPADGAKRLSAPGPVRSFATSLPLLSITLIGGALRLLAIGQKGIWLDEAFSIWLGWQHLPRMWGWIGWIDQHPPLYYILLNLWMRLGDDAATVRLLSAVLGVLTIPIVFVLGRRLAGSLVGLLAALLLAVSPYHVRFAQEARMYALLTFTAAGAMACLAYLLTDHAATARGAAAAHENVILSGSVPSAPQSGQHSEESFDALGASSREATHRDFSLEPRRNLIWPHDPLRVTAGAVLRTTTYVGRSRGLAWVGYVVFTLMAMLTHSAAMLLLLSMNLFVLGLILRRRLTAPAPQGPAAGELAALAPPDLRQWLLAQAAVVMGWALIWLPAFTRQVSEVYRQFWLPAPTWLNIVDMLGNFLSAYLPRTRLPGVDVVWIVYAALLVGAISVLRRRPVLLALLLTLFLAPVLGELLLSLRRPVFYDRTLLWVTIPLFVLLAIGIAALRRRLYIVPAILILVTANGISLHEYYLNFQKEDWRGAAAYVARQAREGDLILFNASWTQIPFDYYFRASSLRLEEHGLPEDLFQRGSLEPAMTSPDLARLQVLLRGRDRVWLVYSHNWYTDPEDLILKALSQRFGTDEARSFDGLEIRLFEDRNDG
jgi:hypothetical protein